MGRMLYSPLCSTPWRLCIRTHRGSFTANSITYAGNSLSLAECAEAFVRDSKSDNEPTLFNPSRVRIPRAFGKYELVDKIAEGASGVVFSCIDTDTDEPFAIKIIRAEGVYDRNVLHRFLREIRALRTIDHDHVIKLREDNLDSEREFPAYVMEFGRGSD